MHYKILKQFDELIVVVKSSGVLSIPARDAKDTRPVLGRILETDLKTKIYPVHRLDFEVSGIMLYALSAPMHKMLSTCFENHEIEKTYYALGEKFESIKEMQTWKSLLLKGKKRTYEASFGKPSTTYATALENTKYENHEISRWELKPKTGRSHQLRFEMMKHGHTIVGDKLYGSEIVHGENSIALCSAKITFPAHALSSPWNLPQEFALSTDAINQLLLKK